jgi:hypothetical protein
MNREAIEAYLRHAFRVSHGDISGEDADQWTFEMYFNPLVLGNEEQPPQPDLALDIVVELIEGAPDDESLAYIAAGPLEGLVVDLGDELIERIEQLAKERPRFQKALAGVFLTRSSKEVAQRIRAVRGAAW